jgi:hypothetical protein
MSFITWSPRRWNRTSDLRLANRRPPTAWVSTVLGPRSLSGLAYPSLHRTTGTPVAWSKLFTINVRSLPPEPQAPMSRAGAEQARAAAWGRGAATARETARQPSDRADRRLIRYPLRGVSPRRVKLPAIEPPLTSRIIRCCRSASKVLLSKIVSSAATL